MTREEREARDVLEEAIFRGLALSGNPKYASLGAVIAKLPQETRTKFQHLTASAIQVRNPFQEKER